MGKTTIPENGARVSTVFLGLDHNFGSGGPPILWETMIFNVETEDGYQFQERYSTREEAIAGHAAAVEYARILKSARLS